MPEPPVVSIVGGGDHEPAGDLLVSGDDLGARRLSPRAKVRLTLLVLLASAALVVAAAAQQRRERRAEQEAFVGADEVDLEGRLLELRGQAPGSGRLAADVTVASRDGRHSHDLVTGVRIEGAGLAEASAALGALGLPVPALAEASVDCAQVAAGRLPRSAVIVVTVVPASGVPHHQRLPVPAPELRRVVLQACDQPDPRATPYVEISAQDGRLLVFVATVPRSKTVLRLEGLRVPGFELAPVPWLTLPHVLPRGGGGLYAFTPRVVHCGQARAGRPHVTALLREDGRRLDQPARPSTQRFRTGTLPADGLLLRLVDEAC